MTTVITTRTHPIHPTPITVIPNNTITVTNTTPTTPTTPITSATTTTTTTTTPAATSRAAPIVILSKSSQSSPRGPSITIAPGISSVRSARSGQSSPTTTTAGGTTITIQKSQSASAMQTITIATPNRSVAASPVPSNRPIITVNNAHAHHASISTAAATTTSSTAPPASATLQCHNCDELNSPLAVWCMECFDDDRRDAGETNTADSSSESDSSRARALRPFVLCETCDGGLHKPAKMSKHIRTPFQCKLKTLSTTESKSLSLPSPLSLSWLCCWSCSRADVHQWCRDCLHLYCTECSRDVHTAKAKKFHQRFPIHQASTRYALTNTKHAQQCTDKDTTTGQNGNETKTATMANNNTNKNG